MATLTCDICGGKLVMGPNGFAVCESCGMQHSIDRMREKVQEIKGVVRVDNSHLIENFLTLASNAYEAGNKAEAESYCNKIIEIDPSNFSAWLFKGKSAGWQSTLDNNRFSESVSAFSKAILYAPDEIKNSLIEDTKEELKSLSVALISLRSERFAKWLNQSETDGFLSDIVTVSRTLLSYIEQVGEVVPLIEVMAPIATQIDQAVANAWSNKIVPEYKGDDNRPGKYEWETFIERVGFCTTLLKSGINLCNDDDDNDILRYQKLISLHNEAINSCSWDFNYDTTFGITSKLWHKEYFLAASAKQKRGELILEYNKKISEIKVKKDKKAKELADKRFKEYWESRTEERRSLEKEREAIKDKISIFNKEMDELASKTDIPIKRKEIENLTNEKKALGLFKSKEKKVFQDQIDILNDDISILKSNIDVKISEKRKQIQPLQTRVNFIDHELTKAR